MNKILIKLYVLISVFFIYSLAMSADSFIKMKLKSRTSGVEMKNQSLNKV